MRNSSELRANHFLNHGIYPCDAMKFVGVKLCLNKQGE